MEQFTFFVEHKFTFFPAESSSVKLKWFIVKYLFVKKLSGYTIPQDN